MSALDFDKALWLRDKISMATEDLNLKVVVEALKRDFNPTKLILYGSRASGTHRPDSDYDFVMVLLKFDKKDRYDVMSKISTKFFQDIGIEVQVWVYSEDEFNDWKDEFSSIPETALNTGREIELG